VRNVRSLASSVIQRAMSIDQRWRSGAELSQVGSKTVFILSTGRTGTQFLAELLNRHKDVYAVHEPPPSRRMRLWSMAYLQGEASDEKMADVLRRYRSTYVSSVREKIYVESNNFLAGFADVIKREFKDAVLIHVVRDPRTYIRSSLNHGGDSGLKGWANRHFPYWHLPPRSIQDALAGAGDHEVLVRTALYWKVINEYLDRAGEGYPHYHRFRFEEMFGDDTTVLEKIFRLAGVVEYSSEDLKAREQKVNESQLQVMDRWQTWSADQARAVDRICGPLMEKYGYGGEEAWLAKTS
jgi:Sulfotransferase family